MSSELVIQLQSKDGIFNCEKFENLPSPKSVYIVICFTDTIQAMQFAIELKTKLVNSIANIESNFNSSTPPCNGNIQTFGKCQALEIADNLKLLIVVSDGNSSSLADKSILNWEYEILPVLKKDSNISLPNPFNKFQVAFWNTNIEEVIPSIYALIGIIDEDQKIFISYRRTESSELAEQLFDKLNHEGFEVFLDRFSIKPGLNFQNRLYQELADKAMIIFLESPKLLESDWVKLEIAFAKKYRLGVLSININSSTKIMSIDDEYRRNVSLNSSSKLDDSELEFMVREIKLQHSIALFRMRHYLNNNIIAALKSKGANATFDKSGFLTVLDKEGKLHYKIWATARPPKVNDYHYADISHVSGVKIIFGPEFREQKRELLNSWLCKKTVVEYYNEGRILELINLIYP